jgi:hypothetical protein
MPRPVHEFVSLPCALSDAVSGMSEKYCERQSSNLRARPYALCDVFNTASPLGMHLLFLPSSIRPDELR